MTVNASLRMSAPGLVDGFQAPETSRGRATEQVNDDALIGRGVGVGADTTEPHPLTHSMHGIDLTADADDVDDDS